MSSGDEETSGDVSSASAATAPAVDSKAKVVKLLDEWEKSRRGGTDGLLSVLTK